jgi:4-amino-4-deoxy-L-arabinose transferase-like glycosyltransferase
MNRDLTDTIKKYVLRKPLSVLTAICLISVVAWIGRGDYYTKGEPREASVAVSMLTRNQWTLPDVYAGEKAYKPPFTHWLTAIFSLPQGRVTPFSSRLPSALAFTAMILIAFPFFRRLFNLETAFLTCLVMLTSFELHRAAMTSRVDMTLTFFTVAALILLFRWEHERGLRGFPLMAVLAMSGATLTKGPVGIVLPLLVAGVYLVVLRYNLPRIIRKLLIPTLASLVLPTVWYYLARRVGGQEYFDLVWAENFGRFFGQHNLNIRYDLGHEEGWWYNFMTLAAGFLPWTLLVAALGLGQLVAIRRNKTKIQFRPVSFLTDKLIRKEYFHKEEKVLLFSALSACLIIVFYCIPMSKRSVYLMPAYPFIAFFVAIYVLRRKQVVRRLQLLYPAIAVYVALWIVIDATILPAWKNSISQRPFAEELKRKYELSSTNIYAMNDLRDYSNMYGLNFYFDNSFQDFAVAEADSGYLFAGVKSFDKIEQKYGASYSFETLEHYENRCRDGESEILLLWFRKRD